MGAAENTSVQDASRAYPTCRLAALSQLLTEAPRAGRVDISCPSQRNQPCLAGAGQTRPGLPQARQGVRQMERGEVRLKNESLAVLDPYLIVRGVPLPPGATVPSKGNHSVQAPC